MQLKKSTGEYQPFDRDKFHRSLLKSGASEKFVWNLSKQAEKLEAKLKSTEHLFDYAHRELSREDKGSAMRYSLKKALFEFGPTGYPFEQYVARILKKLGYEVQTNVFVRGYCVSHEVDILAHKDNLTHLFECKFHQFKGNRTNVKTVLYVKARFDDIAEALKEKTDPRRLAPTEKMHQAWLVTNTKHTTEAEKYAACAGIKIISWGHPEGGGLEQLIAKTKLYPITVLLTLSAHLKRKLFGLNVVTVEDVVSFKDWDKFTKSERNQFGQLEREAELLLKYNDKRV
ncbi:MAG: restriction endonuclease [Patescibacteria group bacterium]|nr:restriction endonuclease [Patescibacteria group bacterium]